MTMRLVERVKSQQKKTITFNNVVYLSGEGCPVNGNRAVLNYAKQYMHGQNKDCLFLLLWPVQQTGQAQNRQAPCTGTNYLLGEMVISLMLCAASYWLPPTEKKAIALLLYIDQPLWRQHPYLGMSGGF